MKRVDGGPAFPGKQAAIFAPILSTGEVHHQMPATAQHVGMSVRDYFAAHAPITMEDARNYWKRTATDYRGNWPDMSVLLAVLAKLRGEYADTMIAERAA